MLSSSFSLIDSSSYLFVASILESLVDRWLISYIRWSCMLDWLWSKVCNLSDNQANSSLMDSNSWAEVDCSCKICPLNSSATRLAIFQIYSSFNWIINEGASCFGCLGTDEVDLVGDSSDASFPLTTHFVVAHHMQSLDIVYICVA